MPEIKPAQLESLFGLIVHDLRNPAATLGANLSFVREVLGDPSVPEQEMVDALSDAQQALGDLMRGLDQLAWMGRWANDRAAATTSLQDVRIALEGAKRRLKYGPVELELPDRELLVHGGEALERLIELLAANGHQHAPGKLVRIRALRSPQGVVVEIEDEGRALASEFQPSAFTLEGQIGLKGRADGRYGRVGSLFAAGILAQVLGAQLGAVERDGKNVFRIALRAP